MVVAARVPLTPPLPPCRMSRPQILEVVALSRVLQAFGVSVASPVRRAPLLGLAHIVLIRARLVQLPVQQAIPAALPMAAILIWLLLSVAPFVSQLTTCPYSRMQLPRRVSLVA